MIKHGFYVILPLLGLLTACQTVPMTSSPINHTAVNSPVAPVFFSNTANLPFSEAVKVGNTLYLSGQIGLKDGKLIEGGVAAETKQIFDNINQVLVKNGYRKSDLVKCTAMLKDMKQFPAFNQAYKVALSQPYPARSTFGVSDLALGANVEIECIAFK